jgi:hypothetical protein
MSYYLCSFELLFTEEHTTSLGLNKEVKIFSPCVPSDLIVKNAESPKVEPPSSNGELDEETLQQNRLRIAQRMAAGGRSPKARTEK